MVDIRSRLFAHRGLWLNRGVFGNSLAALSDAVQNGYSVETDIRDYSNGIIVEHDPASKDAEVLKLRDLLEELGPSLSPGQTIALNVKSDGLPSLFIPDSVSDLLRKMSAFFFDMSVPETVRYSRANLPFAQRLSEYEPIGLATEINWPTPPSAYWIDGFISDWFLEKDGIILKRLAEKAAVVVVSSELHGRPNSKMVEWFRQNLTKIPNISICTDAPEDYEIE